MYLSTVPTLMEYAQQPTNVSFSTPPLVYTPVMHSAPPLESSSGESERPSHSAISPIGEQFAITPSDASILNGYLEEFQKADTESRSRILERAMGELYALRPSHSTFDKKEAKKVLFLLFHECFSDSKCTAEN